ncbi:Phenolphthiocerol synthesis polyketide synthase type I Pks15/1 [Halioglobus japonicus]|nr:Phenolphthiocerol synthesis polyketide synthase type I Pks15/1 [Halioglobus japonicus]
MDDSQHRTGKSHSPTDIAIVGMSCVFPQAPDIQTYWRNIVTKTNAITDPPADRLIDDVFDSGADANDRIYCRRGGYIDDNTEFNPIDYGIMPVSVEGAEPEHFMALKVAEAALKDAGFGDLPFNKDKFEVILGRGTYVNRGYVNLLQHGLVVDQTLALLKQLHPDIAADTLADIKASLKSSLPPFTTETAPGLASSVMTGIIANRMDLKGRTYTVDAACASALIAMENAVQDLASGHSDAALVGAVQISTPAVIHMLFTQLNALTRHQSLKPFDSDTDGTMLGEGIGMVVLKRLDDAIRDGHRIYAVVKAVGSSSDGKAKGLLAPRPEGEAMALSRAYAKAAVDPNSIGLIEAHGTGLRLGDATEIASLGSLFGNDGARTNKIAVGTVKSMIGHLIPAAGIAGIIKTALALYHKTLPPTLGIDNPNEELGIDKTPMYLNTETRPWIHGHTDAPRRAGVNAFGFGGINAHTILEEYAGPESAQSCLNRQRECEFLSFSADSREALIEQCRSVVKYLQHRPDADMLNVAYTLWHDHQSRYPRGQAPAQARLGIVASDIADLEKKLTTSIKQLQEKDRQQIRNRKGVFYTESPLGKQGTLALLFPGEGSQYVNMLKDLSLIFPVVRESFDLLDRAFVDHERGFVPSEFIFPTPLSDEREAEDRLFNMDGAVDAVISADRALFRLITSLGIKADVIVGHSSGEIMALEAAGAIQIPDESELIRFIQEGNRAIEALAKADNIPEGQLLAVGGVERQDIEDVIEQSDGRLILAMENCPHQFVLCAKPVDIEAALPFLAERGALCQNLPFSRAYHTHLFERALGPLKSFFDTLPISAPEVPLYSCLSADRFPDDEASIRELAVLQWARTVRFKDTIEKMHDDGARIFLEIGPRSNLTGFAGDILKDRDALVVACNSQRKTGLSQLLNTLSQLFAHGVEMGLDPLFQSRQGELLDFSELEPASAKATYRLALGLPIIKIAEDQARSFASELAATPTVAVTTPIAAIPSAPLPIGAGGADNSVSISATEGHQPQPPAATASGTVAPVIAENDAAAAVVAEYFKTMDAFLELQQQAMLGMMGADAETPPETTPGGGGGEPAIGPLQGNVTEYEPGVRLVMQHQVNLSQQQYLHHHTLGGSISKYDANLVALPVYPLSMVIEVMAEAALAFDSREQRSQRSLVKITHIELLDWLLLEGEESLSLLSSVVADESGAIAVGVAIWKDGAAVNVASCNCVFSDSTYGPLATLPLSIGVEKPALIDSADYYPGMLFHGAAFQSVKSIEILGSEGNQSTLQLPSAHWYQQAPDQAAQFVAQPILLDAIGQTVGLWLVSQFDHNYVAFPTGIDEIAFSSAAFSWQDTASVRVRTVTSAGTGVSENDLSVVSDAVVSDVTGQQRVSISGLRHRRVIMPNLFHEFRGSRDVRLTSRNDHLVPSLPGGGPFHCRVADLMKKAFWSAENGIWEKVLAYIILSRRERNLWLQMVNPVDRIDWLIRMLTIKETAVEFLQAQQSLSIYCADVEVDIQGDSSVFLGGAWLDDGQDAPLVVSSKVTNDAGELFDFCYITWAAMRQDVSSAFEAGLSVTQDGGASAGYTIQ